MKKIVIDVVYTLSDSYFDGHDTFIKNFMTEGEARAYLLGVREIALGIGATVKAKIDGKEV